MLFFRSCNGGHLQCNSGKISRSCYSIIIHPNFACPNKTASTPGLRAPRIFFYQGADQSHRGTRSGLQKAYTFRLLPQVTPACKPKWAKVFFFSSQLSIRPAGSRLLLSKSLTPPFFSRTPLSNRINSGINNAMQTVSHDPNFTCTRRNDELGTIIVWKLPKLNGRVYF